MRLKPIIHHRYNGETRSHARHGEDRVRRNLPQKKTARLCLGRGVGRERFSVKARSGVGGYSNSNWITCRQVTKNGFVSSWGYYRIAAGKRRGERKEREAPLAQELEHTRVNL